MDTTPSEFEIANESAEVLTVDIASPFALS